MNNGRGEKNQIMRSIAYNSHDDARGDSLLITYDFTELQRSLHSGNMPFTLIQVANVADNDTDTVNAMVTKLFQSTQGVKPCSR